MKNLILLALLVTVLVVGGYLAWTTFVHPPAAPSAANAAPQDNSAGTMMQATIVPATLNKDGIPTQLGALKLTNSQLGKDALNEFAQLHGQGFDLINGYRADYANGDSKLTLWVGQAKDANAAQGMVKTMADKIGGGNPMFTDLSELSISNRTIYEVKGQGQLHFFYAVNDKIVWVATDPNNAADALHSMWSAVK